jgi:hypothetical protein
MREAVDEKLLRALLEGRGVSEFMITQDDAGKFVLSVRYTGATRWLAIRSRDSNPRTWANLQTLAAYMWKLGIREWKTELSQAVVTGHAHRLKPHKDRLG